jgi:hypothetical protein
MAAPHTHTFNTEAAAQQSCRQIEREGGLAWTEGTTVFSFDADTVLATAKARRAGGPQFRRWLGGSVIDIVGALEDRLAASHRAENDVLKAMGTGDIMHAVPDLSRATLKHAYQDTIRTLTADDLRLLIVRVHTYVKHLTNWPANDGRYDIALSLLNTECVRRDRTDIFDEAVLSAAER